MPRPAGCWHPLSLPLDDPRPLRQSALLELSEPVAVDADLAAFLSLGLAPLWEQPWSWHWAGNGYLHLFQFEAEVLRARVRPTAVVPGSAWQVTQLLHSPRMTAVEAEDCLRDALEAAFTSASSLRGLPTDEAHARAASTLTAPAPPHSPEVIADTLSRRFPNAVSALQIGGIAVPLPAGLTAVGAWPERGATLVTFDDDARLWIHSARVSIDMIGFTAVVGGALLWPGPAWPLPQPVASWAFLAPYRRGAHRLRGWDGADLELTAFQAAVDVGISDVSFDLPFVPSSA